MKNLILALIVFLGANAFASENEVDVPGSQTCFCLKVQNVWALFYDDQKGGGHKLDDNNSMGYTLGKCFEIARGQYAFACFPSTP